MEFSLNPIGIDQYSAQTGSLFSPEAQGERAAAGASLQKQETDNINEQGGVRVTLSDEALEKTGLKPEKGGGTEGLSEEEKREVEKLKKLDRNVRSHERAHMMAGAGLITRGASFEYQTGPDGNRYAVGGDVQIDTSKEKEPEDTLQKAQRIRAAATAPADPSPQDRRVAADAMAMANSARMELARKLAGEEEEAKENAEKTLNNTPPEEETGARGIFPGSFAPAGHVGQAYQGPSNQVDPSLSQVVFT